MIRKIRSALPLMAVFLLPIPAAAQRTELVMQVGHTEDIDSFTFSADGRLMATGSQDSSVKLWDVETGRQLRTLNGHFHWVNSVAFNRDGRMLASGDAQGVIMLWNVETGQIGQTLKDRCTRIESITFYPGQPFLASSCSTDESENLIQLWDVITGRKLSELPGRGPLAFSPDARLLASRSEYSVKILDLQDGKTQQFPVKFGEFGDTISFSSDGKLLAQAGDREAMVWDVEKNRKVSSWKNPSSFRMISFISNSHDVMTVDEKGVMVIVRPASGSKSTEFSGLGSVKYSTLSASGLLAVVNHESYETRAAAQGGIVKL